MSKPNTLTITVSDANGKDVTATMALSDVQNVYNANKNEGQVRDAVYGVFKQLVDRIKNNPAP
jgi:hypothetical protein|tara:strand:+ start:2311 stop:2499 length:189 start_codon:yes stop_codon:yes gene_type:complete